MGDRLVDIGAELFKYVCGVIDSERDGCPNSAEAMRLTIQEALTEAAQHGEIKNCVHLAELFDKAGPHDAAAMVRCHLAILRNGNG